MEDFEAERLFICQPAKWLSSTERSKKLFPPELKSTIFPSQVCLQVNNFEYKSKNKLLLGVGMRGMLNGCRRQHCDLKAPANEIWLKPIGLTTVSMVSFRNVVFLCSQKRRNPGRGFNGSIVLSFSAGALSLPFTSSRPKHNRD